MTVGSLRSQVVAQKAVYLSYEEARPIIEALSEVAPAELQGVKATDAAGVWSKWSARRDAEIRARLIQGDEDSVINFMLFGTSFTRRPRLTLSGLAQLNQQMSGVESPEANAYFERIKLRADDLIQGMIVPGNNERLLFARRWRQGLLRRQHRRRKKHPARAAAPRQRRGVR